MESSEQSVALRWGAVMNKCLLAGRLLSNRSLHPHTFGELLQRSPWRGSAGPHSSSTLLLLGAIQPAAQAKARCLGAVLTA